MEVRGPHFFYAVKGLFANQVWGSYVTRTRWVALRVKVSATSTASLSRTSSFLLSDQPTAEGVGVNRHRSVRGPHVGARNSKKSRLCGSVRQACFGGTAVAARREHTGTARCPSRRRAPAGVATRAMRVR